MLHITLSDSKHTAVGDMTCHNNLLDSNLLDNNLLDNNLLDSVWIVLDSVESS